MLVATAIQISFPIMLLLSFASLYRG